MANEEDTAPAEEAVEQPPPEQPPPITFAEFLESIPPAQYRRVANVRAKRYRSGSVVAYHRLETPEIQLHCPNDTCNGLRFFRYNGDDIGMKEKGPENKQLFITYICANCQRTYKTFAINVRVPMNAEDGICYKYGEHPVFGPPTPARLIRLFGNDREIFLKGRRCENQGLGVGAFTYYRRVVESHKNQILSEIIKVSEKVGAPAGMIRVLEDAKNEIQFSKALASVKDAIPPSLLINGHNPLTLLHSALSKGVHDLTDEQCLELAHDVRVVLVELAEALGQALKDEAELNTAINRLMNIKKD
jgi:hypothetical protein